MGIVNPCLFKEVHELVQDNDIILCDGDCHRAYHEKCVEPPLNASTLPEDEGWLCPACDAKVCPLSSCNSAALRSMRSSHCHDSP